FDYVIVGAGSAGCVLANRLTEDGKATVLLLEAGPRDTDPWIHIPLGYGKLFNKRSVNWSYYSEPEPQLNGRKIFTPRGKVLGGSSSINGLVYTRGQPEDFDDWETPGWSFGELLPYFKKSEDQVGQGLSGDALHGRGGPLAVSDQTEPHELCDAFIEAAVQAGHPRNQDFNGPRQEGAGYQQLTARNGRRCSTAVGYLRPAQKRANLTVVTGALASKVLFEGKKAVGVRYLKGSQGIEARANREVILSGGAINSPQLLQLSGVGPAALLKEHGIPVVLDQPHVGEHMQDHFQARIVLKCARPITVNDDLQSWWRMARMGLRYALLRKGPLSVSAGYAGGFWRTRPELKRPDVQTHFLTFSLDRMGEKLHPFSGFTASICQLQPTSRGYVRIRSGDPREAPAIRYNYLATEHDRRTMLDGMRLLRRILEQPAIKPYIASEHMPGAKVQSDDEWLGYFRDTGSTIYHPTCTAKMGTGDDAVVDSRLRVKGIDGLRVVDASVMPSVVSGNTNAAVIAIAEKAADLIHSNRGGGTS
ncbi:MAG TPA: choline dehydrogenase, partial [Burkholderiales bacterium]|nr:choline dehydrogenase [Burkholderiales bacterium]